MPGLHDLGPLAALAVVALAFVLMAGRITRAAPEVALVAGWGACCLMMTAWATLLPLSLRLGFGMFAVLAGTGPRGPGRGGSFGARRGATPAGGLWRTALLSAPLFLVLAPALPSQVDTWLNLLPNLAYLVDHAMLPKDGGPPSWSFLPGAPYNTQFVGFAVSLLSGRLVTNAISLFNALLLCAAGLRLARVVAPVPGQPAWWACAAGLLLAVPLNPGFVPRVFLASYGEAPLAVTLMFAVVLGADLFAAMRAGAPIAGVLASLALVLAAMVEIKQSALGLLLPFAATLLALGLAAPGVDRRRWATAVGGATAPALGLYLLWRWYVLGHFAVGELKMLPLAAWHLNLLPRIVAGIAWAMFQKATYFIAIGAMLFAAWREARLRAWQHAAVVLALGAGLVAGFNAFLLFTYVAHFPAVWAVNAHSYFRYMSQLSLVVMLGLATWLRPAAAGWIARWPGSWRRRGAAGLVAVAVTLPVVGARMLRFDLDAPQPLLWDMAHRTAGLVPDSTRLALVMPGDGDDAVGSLLRGVLLFTPPRRAHLDFRSELTASPAALEDARRAGFTHALVTCAPVELAGLPAGMSGLLAFEGGAWHPVAAWALPAGLGRTRFSAMLPHGVFCDRSPGK